MDHPTQMEVYAEDLLKVQSAPTPRQNMTYCSAEQESGATLLRAGEQEVAAVQQFHVRCMGTTCQVHPSGESRDGK